MVKFPKRSWTDEIHEFLSSLIPKAPGLACFDFDNTLIRNDFGEKIMDQIITEGLSFLPNDLSPFFRDKDTWKDHQKLSISEKEHLVWEEYSYQLKEFGIEKGYRWTSFLFQGLTEQEFYEISLRAWKQVNHPDRESGVFPQPEMKDLIAFLNYHNWDVYIVTASPEPGIVAIADLFPVKKDRVIGMRQEIDENNRYSAKLIEPYTYGEGKVKAIESRIGRYPDIAFGDSFNDYPMLQKATQLGVGIDRGNPEFVEACIQKGIKVQPYFLFQK